VKVDDMTKFTLIVKTQMFQDQDFEFQKPEAQPVLGKITCKMIIVKDQDDKAKTDLKSRSKITGLEMISDQDHLISDPRSKITQTYA